MVVGPVMQGVVLMGIIYWYSKGMISMINDYYRSEFQRKLNDANNESIVEVPNYDVENLNDLLSVEDFIKNVEISSNDETKRQMTIKESIPANVEYCNGPKNLAYFMYLIGLNSSDVYVECWRAERRTFERI